MSYYFMSLLRRASGIMGGELKTDWVQLWTEWAIQILVLISFTLQIILLLFAGIRRRNTSTVLKILLWLAYLLADFTATYALGHLSTNQCTSDRSRKHHLVAFWAPFLLLHLGGQDTITAYSLEDNKLWLRHLLTLGTQVLGAVYILYKSIAGGSLFIPAILIFLAGVLKYGERIWALKCANMDSIRSSLDKSDVKVSELGRALNLDGANQHENAMLEAHSLFQIYKRLFADLMIEWDLWDFRNLRGVEAESAYLVIELELSLMYDILYTKAAVIHTWYGYCIRVVSLLSTVAALVLFEVGSKDGYSRVDVAITYVLLLGASVLEVNAIFWASVSTWTCAFLKARQWHQLLRLVFALLRLNRAETNRRWSNSAGQYNLISFCVRDKTELRGRIAKLIGLEDWWNKVHYTSYVEVSPEMKGLILQELEKKAATTQMEATAADFRNCRGQWVLQRRGLSERLGWSVAIDFDESILVWHIATDIFLHCFNEANVGTEGAAFPGAIKALSNYMLFLLVVHPSMLPGPARHSRYVDTCKDLVELWDFSSREEFQGFVHGPHELLLVMEEGLKEFYSGRPNRSALSTGARLAKILLGLELEISERFQVVAAVWVEMLCYAANNCTGNFHAEQLSSSGELATVVWFLMAHVGVEGHLLERPLADYGRALFSGNYVVYSGQGEVVYSGRAGYAIKDGDEDGGGNGGDVDYVEDNDNNMEISEEHDNANVNGHTQV